MPNQTSGESATPFSTAGNSGSATNPSPVKPAAPVVDRVAETAHATIDKLAEKTAPKIEQLSKSVTDAGDLLRHRKEQALEKGNDLSESIKCTVRENPLAALGTAFLLGALVARLSR